MDKCERCGCEGNDRRTLFMRCMYDMAELKIPFKEIRLETKSLDKGDGEERAPLWEGGPTIRHTKWKKETIFESPINYGFYTIATEALEEVKDRSHDDWIVDLATESLDKIRDKKDG